MNAEISVVGAAMISPSAYDLANLEPSHFSDPKCALTWRAIGSLRARNEPIDAVTLSSELERDGILEQVGYKFLTDVALAVPTSDNVAHYASLVRDSWLVKKALYLVSDIQRIVSEGATGDEVLGVLSSRLLDLYAAGGRKLRTLGESVQEQLGSIEADRNDPSFVSTGLPLGFGLDDLVPNGIPRNQVTVIYAETGGLKTTFKANLIDMVSKVGGILDCSLEDGPDIAAETYLSRETLIPYSRIKNRDLSEEELETLSLSSKPENVFLTDNVPHRIEEIIRIANQHKQQHGIVACIVDYIQLLDYGALSEREAISDAVKKVQISAKHDKIAYILLSQVKQDVATREDHRPQLSDTFGSASLQTGCKLAIGLFRPHKYERIPTGYYQEICNNHPMGTSVYPGIVELWVTKNRSGRSGEFALAWCDLPTGKFHAMDKLANE